MDSIKLVNGIYDKNVMTQLNSMHPFRYTKISAKAVGWEVRDCYTNFPDEAPSLETWNYGYS